METFDYIYDDYQHDKLNSEEAAQMLGVSVRHFLRLRDRYDEEGISGLKNRGVGRVSKRRAGDAEIAKVTTLCREKYSGFNVRHFHEFARRDHGLNRSYTWTRTVLAKAGCRERRLGG